MRKKSALIYGLLYVGLLLLYIFLDLLGWINKPSIIHICMIVAISIVIIFNYIKWKKLSNSVNDNTCDNVVIVGNIIIAIGLIMRIGYTMYTPWDVRPYDVSKANLRNTGHASYILHLFYGRLPRSNTYQFYHPPLFHMLSSITMHIVGIIKGFVKEGELLIDSAKIVSCFASCGVLLQVKEFLNEVDIKGKIKNIILTIIAFFPGFYLMAGRVNNDSLVLFFMVIALRYTYKWYYNQDWNNIIILALAFGFGMMTKISMGVLAIFTAVFMIMVFVKNVKKVKLKTIILQLIVFGLLSFPLGLWYPIRNYILFKQPLNYVLKFAKTSQLYIGNVSWHKRFLFNIKYIIDSNEFVNMISDFNMPTFLLKSSLFGEFAFDTNEFYAIVLLGINGVLIIISLVAMISVIIFSKENKIVNYGLFFAWLCQMISYIAFNIDFPFSCTMDFRYIPITVIIGAIFIGKFSNQIENGNKVCRVFNKLIYYSIIIFVMASFIVFTTLK